MSEKKLEDLELRYLEWRVEYGEDLPQGVNTHPWSYMGFPYANRPLSRKMERGLFL